MIRSLALGLVLATGALAGKLPPGEGQTPPFAVVQPQPPAGAPSIAPPSKKPPFENLFQTPPQNPADPDVAGLVEELKAKTKVVCGLTMTQVDPNTDPKIRRDIPTATAQKPNLNKQTDFKIRRVTPTVCRE